MERSALFEIALVLAAVAGVLAAVLWIVTTLPGVAIAAICAGAWTVGVAAVALTAS